MSGADERFRSNPKDFARVIPRSPCLHRHLSEMMDRINKRLRAKIKSRGYGDHSHEVCAASAIFFLALRQFQSRIEATTYEQAWHDPFPESPVAPHWIRA